MIRLQEAENQIIVDYEVYARRPNDSDLLIPAIAAHQVKLGRVPRLVAADAGFYFARNEAAASAFPIARPRVPNANESRGSAGSAMARNGAPDARDAFSVVKRRHGLSRCRYKADDGMQRWVGLGVIADNLLNIGRTMNKRTARRHPPLPL
jgi:IS5 family transposase